MKTALLALASLATLGSGPASSPASPLEGLPSLTQDGQEDRLTRQLLARAERAIKEDGLEGMAVVIAVGGDVLLQKGWGRFPGGGLASAEVPVRAESLVEPLAGIAALQMVKSGDLSLEAPVGRVLEGLAWEDGSVTLHHLLSQTSGLIGWDAALPLDTRGSATKESLLALVKEQGLQSGPGSCFEYSESNGLVLGALVEAASKKTLAEVITERILGPAGVEVSGFDVDGALPEQPEADGSREIAGELIPSPEGVHVFGEDEFSASALDLLRIRKALTDRKLLDDAGIEALTGNKRLEDGTETGYGYGVNLTTLGEFGGVSVGGSAEGTTVHLAYYLEPDVTVVVVVTEESAPIIGLERDLARIVLDLPLPGIQDLELEADIAARFVGRYQLGCTTYVVAVSDEGALTVAVADRPEVVLRYQGQARFVAVDDAEYRYEFVVEEGDQQASSMILDEHGRRSEAVRFQR